MAIRTVCPGCGKALACPESAIGRTATCKFCGDRFTVQAAPDAGTPPGPAPAVPGRTSALPGSAPLPSAGSGGASAWGSARGAAPGMPQNSGMPLPPSPSLAPPSSQPVSPAGFPGPGPGRPTGFPGAGPGQSGGEPQSRLAMMLEAHARGLRLPPSPSRPAYPAEGGFGEMAAAGCLGASVMFGLPFFGLIVLAMLFGGRGDAGNGGRDRNAPGGADGTPVAWRVAADPLPAAGKDVPTHVLGKAAEAGAVDPTEAMVAKFVDAPPTEPPAGLQPHWKLEPDPGHKVASPPPVRELDSRSVVDYRPARLVYRDGSRPLLAFSLGGEPVAPVKVLSLLDGKEVARYTPPSKTHRLDDVSPDGDWAAWYPSGPADPVTVTDHTGSGVQLQLPPAERDTLECLALPGGERAVAVTAGTIHVWDLPQPIPARSIPHPAGMRFAFSPGGRYVAGTAADGLTVFDLSDGTVTGPIDPRLGGKSLVPTSWSAPAFSADGGSLAVIAWVKDEPRLRLRILDFATGSVRTSAALNNANFPTDAFDSMPPPRWLPGGASLLIGYQLVERDTGKPIGRFARLAAAPPAVDENPFAPAPAARPVEEENPFEPVPAPGAGKPAAPVAKYVPPPFAGAILPDFRALLPAPNGGWHLESMALERLAKNRLEARGETPPVAPSVAEGLPEPIQANDDNPSRPVLEVRMPWQVVPDPATAPPGKGYRAFPADVGKLRRVLTAPAGDGLLLTYGSHRAPSDFETSEDLVDVAGRLEARNLADGRLLYKATLPKSAEPLAVDAAGGLLVTVSGKYHDRLDLWNAKTLAHIVAVHPYGIEKGTKLRDNAFGRPVYARTVTWAGFAGPERLWTLSAKGELALWQVPDFRQTCKLPDMGGTPQLSPGRKVLAASRPGSTHFMHAETGEQTGVVLHPRAGVTGERLAFSPDGSRLARLVDDKLRIADLKTGKFIGDQSIEVPGRNLSWAGNDLLLVDASLVDPALGFVVWNYETGDPKATLGEPLPDGRAWLICEPPGRPFVAAVAVPDPGLKEARSRAAAGSRPSEFGDASTVKIDLDLAGLPDDVGIRDDLTRQLAALGLTVDDDGELTLTAKIHVDRFASGHIPLEDAGGRPQGSHFYRFPHGRAEIALRDAEGKTLRERSGPIGVSSAIRTNTAAAARQRLPDGFALEETAMYFRNALGSGSSSGQPTHGKPPKLGYGSTRVTLDALTPGTGAPNSADADSPADLIRPAPRRRPK